MYLAHFGLREMPFSITPDPAYLYMSPRHQEALGHLLYGTGQYGGFVQLTGEVGTGKTMVIRTLLEQKLDNVDVAMIHNPRQSEQEFVQSICDEFGAMYQSSQVSLKGLTDALNAHLLDAHARGRRTVLIIDEAQNLDPKVLEQVRLLTNLETHKEKLLRIMLVGQPELHDLLGRADLRQLAQRITARYHLTPLSEDESAEYVRHRLRVAGGMGDIFDAGALTQVYVQSGGVPRLINIICDRALMGAYALSAVRVNAETVRDAAQETGAGAAPAAEMKTRAERFWLSTEKIWAVLAIAFAGLFFYRELAQRSAPSAPAPVLTQASAPAAPVAYSPSDRLLRDSQPLPVVMTQLIQLWDPKLRLSPGENVCRGLRSANLECMKGEAKLAELIAMNRPAILTLRSGTESQRHVLLTGTSAQSVALSTGSTRERLTPAELEALWNGEFLLLWKPEIAETMIGPNTRGEPVIWLRKRLLQLTGRRPAAQLSGFYDQRLTASVKRWQQKAGLEADGVAGTRTLIALARDQDGAPKLEALP